MHFTKAEALPMVGDSPTYPFFAKPSEKAPWRIAYGISADASSLYIEPGKPTVFTLGKTEAGAEASKDARLRDSLMLPAFLTGFAGEIGEVGGKLVSLSGTDPIKRYLYPGLLAFLFASLWIFPRLSHWKALNLLLALLAFRTFFFVATAFSGELLGGFIDKSFPGTDRDLVSLIAFGVLGLVLVAWDFARGVFGRAKEEA